MALKVSQKKLSKSEIKKIIDELYRALKREQVPITQVVLFGSYAKNTADVDSDIDVALIVNSKKAKTAQGKLREVNWIAKQVNVKLEPHIISTTDMQNPFLSIVAEICKTGKVMYG